MCLGLSLEVRGELGWKNIGLNVSHFFTHFYHVYKISFEFFCLIFLGPLGLQNSRV